MWNFERKNLGVGILKRIQEQFISFRNHYVKLVRKNRIKIRY